MLEKDELELSQIGIWASTVVCSSWRRQRGLETGHQLLTTEQMSSVDEFQGKGNSFWPVLHQERLSHGVP